MNKKRLFILLGLTFSLALTGCSGTKEAKTAETEFSTSAPEEFAEEDAVEIAVEETEAPELTSFDPSEYVLADTSEYVTLGELSGLEITQYTYEITDEMINEQIQYELEMYSEEVEVERAAASGDIIYLDLTSQLDGEEEYTESTYFYLGDEEYGAEFDQQLIGTSVGDSKEFSITFGDEIWMEEWIGQTVNFKAEITSVCELSVPEYTDEFVAEYTDYSSKEEFEEYLRDNTSYEYEELSYTDAVDALFEEAAAQSVFAGYPEDLYETCREELLTIYSAFSGSDNIEDICAMFDITEEDLDAEILDAVDRRLLINAICLEKGLEVTEEEYLSFLEENAQYYGYDNMASFEADYTREAIVWSLYESKAAAALYEEAEITEVPYDFEEFEEGEIIEE